MYVESAFAFTPAAIISEAKVWRHSCSVIGSSPAAAHAVVGAAGDASAVNGLSRRPCRTRALPVAPGAQPVLHQVVAQHGDDRHLAPPGLRLWRDHALPGSQPRSTRITPAARSTSPDAQRPQLAPAAARRTSPSPTAPGRARDGGDQRLGLLGRRSGRAAPRTAGSSQPGAGLTASSPRRPRGGRSPAAAGASPAPWMGSGPPASSRSANSWRSARRTSRSRMSPSSGSTRSRSAPS